MSHAIWSTILHLSLTTLHLLGYPESTCGCSSGSRYIVWLGMTMRNTPSSGGWTPILVLPWPRLGMPQGLLRSCTLTVNITEGLRPSYPSGWKDFTDLPKLESKQQKHGYNQQELDLKPQNFPCSPNHPIWRVKNFECQVGPIDLWHPFETRNLEFGHEQALGTCDI